MPTEILQEIGSYAGLAAVVGLAVLSALYFSQARDVKRLREWAGRAPERSAEQPAVEPATPAGRVVAQPQQPRPPIPVPGRPVAASAAGAAAATTVGPAGATEEHDALADDTGEREAVGAGADNGDTGDREAVAAGDNETLYDETGEHDALYDDEPGDEDAEPGDGDTGEEAEVPVGADTGEEDAVGEDEPDEEPAGDQDGHFAPPEGEPAVAEGDQEAEAEDADAEDAEAEDAEDAEREPVGAQARSEAGPVASSGLAAPPSTPAGGMAGGTGEAPPRPAPSLPPRPTPARPGSPPAVPLGSGGRAPDAPAAAGPRRRRSFLRPLAPRGTAASPRATSCWSSPAC